MRCWCSSRCTSHQAGALLDRHQLVARRHDGRDQFCGVGFKSHIAPGHDAHQVLALEYRHPGDAVGAGQLPQLGYGGGLLDGDGVLDHAALEFLDLAHLLGLLGDGHALVDDADAALLGHCDRQAKLGHRIHGRRHQRDIQVDTAGEPGLERDLRGNHFGIPGQQQDIVKSEGFFGDTQHWVALRLAALS